MAINRKRQNAGYGILKDLAPNPIIAKRDPTSADQAELGATWVNTETDAVYVLTSLDGTATWTGVASAGGPFSSLTITGSAGSDVFTIDDGNAVISNGDLDLTSGDVTIGGNLNVTGDISFTGDFDVTDTASISLTSTNDAAEAIYLHANGGTAETIRLHSDQGTSVSSIDLDSDVGGISLTAGLASDDAINLVASSGGVDIDGALQVNIASSENAADAIVVNASAGGIDITNTGTAGEDIDIASTGASVNISASENAADAITLDATAGGIDILASSAAAGEDIDITATGSSVNITSTESDGAAIVLEASDGAGGVQIKAGTGGILIGNEADTTPIDIGDIAPAASRTVTIAGGTVVTASVTDLVDIAPDGATTNADSIKQVDIASGTVTTGQSIVNINTGTAASGTSTVNISTNTGGGTKTVNVGNADANTTLNIDAVTLINDSVNANTSVNTGSSTGTVSVGNGSAGAVTVDSGAGISIDGATASNFTVTGSSEDLTLSSSGGSVNITATEAAADAIVLNASDSSGGIDLTTGGGSVDISSSGFLTAVDGTDSQSSPTATATVNTNVGTATFTGFTIASAGSQEFVISNSLVSATSALLVTAANEGANDAQMTVTRVERGAGSFTVTLTNNGAAALNGNVSICFWVYNA